MGGCIQNNFGAPNSYFSDSEAQQEYGKHKSYYYNRVCQLWSSTQCHQLSINALFVADFWLTQG